MTLYIPRVEHLGDPMYPKGLTPRVEHLDSLYRGVVTSVLMSGLAFVRGCTVCGQASVEFISRQADLNCFLL